MGGGLIPGWGSTGVRRVLSGIRVELWKPLEKASLTQLPISVASVDDGGGWIDGPNSSGQGYVWWGQAGGTFSQACGSFGYSSHSAGVGGLGRLRH